MSERSRRGVIAGIHKAATVEKFYARGAAVGAAGLSAAPIFADKYFDVINGLELDFGLYEIAFCVAAACLAYPYGKKFGNKRGTKIVYDSI